MINMNKKINNLLLIIMCACFTISCDQNVGKRDIENNNISTKIKNDEK